MQWTVAVISSNHIFLKINLNNEKQQIIIYFHKHCPNTVA